MKNLIVVLISLFVFSCNQNKAKAIDADEVIKESMIASGVYKLDASFLEFDFRDKHYSAVRFKGNFELERRFKDSTHIIRDFVGNNGFQRFVNDSLVKVTDSMATNYSASVNSVHYFSVLPYGLDGKAVRKSFLDSIKLKGESYYKIKVTFDEDGGGEDFDDEFIYWINTQTKHIDYLAYSYNEEDGVGLRFREAYNERIINDIRFVDYNNFKPLDTKVRLEDLDKLFIENRLQLLSKIELENINVN